MHIKMSLGVFLFVFFVQFFAFVSYAHAYIDPGTGSYIFQLLIAGFLGSLFFMKKIFHNFRYFLASIFSHKKVVKKAEESNGTDK